MLLILVGQTYHIDLKPVAQETQPSNRMTSSPQNRSHHNISKAIDHSRKCVEPELQRSQSSSNAAREYQDAIEALRRRNKKDATFIVSSGYLFSDNIIAFKSVTKKKLHSQDKYRLSKVKRNQKGYKISSKEKSF